jgi:hypothetical protein
MQAVKPIALAKVMSISKMIAKVGVTPQALDIPLAASVQVLNPCFSHMTVTY